MGILDRLFGRREHAAVPSPAALIRHPSTVPPYNATVYPVRELALADTSTILKPSTPGRVVIDVNDIAGPDALVVEWPGGLMVTRIDDLQKRWSVPDSEPVQRITQPRTLAGQPATQQQAASQPQRSGEPRVTRHVKTEYIREEPI